MTAGNVDSGAVIGQYVGTLLLTAAFVAIGLFASALTQNQIVSFMVALTLAIGLSLMGMPLVTVALPQAAAVIVQDLSPLTHYRVAIRGVIDLRDVIYFLAVVSAFMSGTYLLLRGKSISHRSNLYLQLRLGVAALVVLSLLVGWFGSSIQGRWGPNREQALHSESGHQEAAFGAGRYRYHPLLRLQGAAGRGRAGSP